MDVDGERTQVFKLDIEKFGKVALSGTAEMAFGGLFMNKNIDFGQSKKVDKYKRVKRYCAVSRCYRAESSRGQQERGIYRVHNFTKGNTIRIRLFLGSVPKRLTSFLNICLILYERLNYCFSRNVWIDAW